MYVYNVQVDADAFFIAPHLIKENMLCFQNSKKLCNHGPAFVMTKLFYNAIFSISTKICLFNAT